MAISSNWDWVNSHTLSPCSKKQISSRQTMFCTNSQHGQTIRIVPANILKKCPLHNLRPRRSMGPRHPIASEINSSLCLVRLLHRPLLRRCLDRLSLRASKHRKGRLHKFLQKRVLLRHARLERVQRE